MNSFFKNIIKICQPTYAFPFTVHGAEWRHVWWLFLGFRRRGHFRLFLFGDRSARWRGHHAGLRHYGSHRSACRDSCGTATGFRLDFFESKKLKKLREGLWKNVFLPVVSMVQICEGVGTFLHGRWLLNNSTFCRRNTCKWKAHNKPLYCRIKLTFC